MAVENRNFLFARMYLRSTASETRVEWLDGPTISVQLRLLTEGPTQQVINSFSVAHGEDARAQELLSALKQNVVAVAAPDCVIELGRAGKVLTTVSWTLSNESAKQRQVRVELERLAHVHYVEAIAFLKRGRALGEKYESAIRAFESGLEALGDRYTGPDLLDDTGAKLILAESVRAHGDLRQGATLTERVLESRIAAYAQRFQIK